MLNRLLIQNYAIIDELEIDFSGKLNVITGETGAGKSIIAGALGLVLGERADTTVLVNKEKKCVVEGIFTAEQKESVQSFLRNNELDPGDELFLRREIASNGKSRAFINDSPVNLSQLQELGLLLVDLHQQFDTLELAQTGFQREMLDALAGNAPRLNAYKFVFSDWQRLAKETEGLKMQQLQFEKEADYNRFQFDELQEASFKENELEDTDARLKALNNAEGIRNALRKAYWELQESESPVLQQLKILSNQLAAFSSYHPALSSLLQRLQSSQVELQDIAADLERIHQQVHYDPEQIERLNERLSLGYRLLKKHGVRSTAELLAIQQQLEEKLQAVLSTGDLIRRKEEELKELYARAVQLAGEISESRGQQLKPLEDKVNKLLKQVGMPNAKLKVELNGEEEITMYGRDAVEFLFNANIPALSAAELSKVKKEGAGTIAPFQPVRKIASGGELSRLMLCIKSLVAQSMDLPTMIFDEIDTGISGEAARQTGIIMKELAAKRQVISITHQPQIAGKADAHFLVYKEIVKDFVKTNIRRLSTEERITTIARMLSGEKPTTAAIENAREMVSN